MSTEVKTTLEEHFAPYRENIVGINAKFVGPYGPKPIVYADWTASGRLYAPIESRIVHEMGHFVANTHTETSLTGKMMTKAYHEAKDVIKHHVNADDHDVFIPTGTGMTGAVLKFQRILGLKYPEKLNKYIQIAEEDRPVVFITHMEHHSNQTSWLETIARVECIDADERGLINLDHLDDLIAQYKDVAPMMIASVTGCSNVTGVTTPYHEIAKKMHRAGGLCFVDFACSGPYVKIDMHPEDPEEQLDAIFFSPHKFLGGPGTPGVLIFNEKLYGNNVPDIPGGGTVMYTNPWGDHIYIDDIETREDGGTPGFLQTIKAALAVRLKEEMGVDNMLEREHELISLAFEKLNHPSIHVLAENNKHRLGVFSLEIENLHYNLGVKILNDRFGIQVRGGCSCAGTYGHYLLKLNREMSDTIKREIERDNLMTRPGWIRMSIHPTMTNQEINYICSAICELAENHAEWGKDYSYNPATNEYEHRSETTWEDETVTHWFRNKLS